MTFPLSKQLASELIGTFCLVFAGTGAIVINDISGGAVGHMGIAITFGLIVLAMIYALGDISGAHFNPAVTIAFTVARRLSPKTALFFIASQLLGAILASLCLRLMFPSHELLGATLPAGSVQQSFVLEVLLTFFLMFVIFGVSTGAKEKGITAGLAIGATVLLEAMFGGPVSGASMNPARSIAPALVSFNLEHVWLYIVAPITGALLAVLGCCSVREKGCCR